MTDFGLFGFGGPTSFEGIPRGDTLPGVRRRVVAALAPTLALVGAALLLASRRLAGALVEPPSFAATAICALTILAAACLSKLIVRFLSVENPGLERPGPWLRLLGAAPWARWMAAMIWAIALSLPGISPAAAMALWSPVGLLAAPRAARFFRSPSGGGSALVPPPQRPVPPAGLPPIDLHPVGAVEESPVGAGHVTARMARYFTAGGEEVVEGTVCVDFAAGARWGAAHLAICPPLAGTPTVDVSADDEFEAEIKVTQALPYAARFDVRLPSPAEEPLSVRLRYRITRGDVLRPSDSSP